MLAVIAAFIFAIGMVLGWVDTNISVPHLISVMCLAGVFVSLHLAFRIWWPDRRL